MRGLSSRARFALYAGLPFLIVGANSFGATQDSWIAGSSGWWRTGGNWSSNAAPDSSFSLVLITNAASKTVTVDAATPSANLGIQKLTVSAPSGATNTLELVDLDTNQPFTLSGTLSVAVGGALRVTNSALTIDGTSGAILSVAAGRMTIEDGAIVDCTTTTASKIGTLSGASGIVGINGGTLLLFQMQLGAASGSQGNLQVSNGLLNCSSLLTLGQSFNSTGLLSVAGGTLLVTNDLTKVGNLGAGQLNVSGGQARFAFLSMGENSGASGTVSLTGGELSILPRTTNDLLRVGSIGLGQLNISGGTHHVYSEMHLADDLSATGLVYVTGGQLIVTNDLTAIGRYGFGQMVVSNSLVELTNASVGRHAGAVGVLVVQAAGVVVQADALSIGRFAGSEGHVLVDGGMLAMTNDNIWVGREGTGELTLRSGSVVSQSVFVGMSPDGTNTPLGTFSLQGGNFLVTSNLVVGTDLISAGHVTMNGGQLVIGSEGNGGVLEVANGDFTFGNGTVSVPELLLTNSGGQFVFNGGSLKVDSATVANGLPFTVGDGSSPAILELAGGTYVFANGLIISSNAKLTGCGTILGDIVNNGTIATNCGGGTDIPPSITQQPQSLTVVQGASAAFSVIASGTEPLTYQWQFGGIDIQGATSSAYTNSSAQAADAGPYSVIVSNSAGSVTSAPAVLAVLLPPWIVTPPQDLVVQPGSSAVFLVRAAGSAPLNYQWRFSGTDIPGATLSTYTKASVQASDAGTYTVVITNIAGSISRSATLALSSPLAIALKSRGGCTNSIALTSLPGTTYTLEYKDSLAGAAWIAIVPAVPGTGAELLLMDTNAVGTMRFYRVQAQ